MSHVFTVQRSFWMLLAGLTVVRLVLAAQLGLTPDEAYYWVWSRHLQGGYLDHPPAVAWVIHASTAILGDTVSGIRVFGPVLALVGSGLIAVAGRDLLNDDGVGRKAALLLNATLFIGLGAATMTPDTPLVFSVSLALFALGRLVRTQHPAWWLLIGAAFGLAFDSKYTAILPAIACGLWFLWARRWRDAGWVCAGACVGLLTVMPVLVWNAQHHWASFIKQGGRAHDWQPWRALQFLAELLGGQIGLATPLVFLLCVVGVAKALPDAKRGSQVWLLSAMVLLPAFVFVQHALGGRVQANWPIVLYPSAVLLGARIAGVYAASGVGMIMTGLVYLQALTGWMPLSAHYDVVARQTSGWGDFANAVEKRAKGGAIVTTDYAMASILRFHTPRQRVASFDPRWTYLGPAKLYEDHAVLVSSEHRQKTVPQGWAPAGNVARACRFHHGVIVSCYRVQNIVRTTSTGALPTILP